MSMTVATRRLLAAFLTDRGMPPQEIADELGISRETLRRDLHNRPDTDPPDTEPDPPADVADDVAPPVAVVLLPETPQLRQDLNLLTAELRGRHEDVGRFAIHQCAQHLRARQQARAHAHRTA